MLDAEWIPAEKPESRWLMVVLHGLGDSAKGYTWVPSQLGIPEMNYLLVNAPDPYYGGFSWYEYGGDPAPGIARSGRSLFELLDARRAAGFPTGQTTLFGFSQGCLMTIEIGMLYPHRFAGLVGVSGYAHHPEVLIREMSPEATRQRFLITHGTADPLIPIDPVREQIRSLQSAGIQIDWREFRKEHTIAGQEEIRVIREFVVAGMRAI